MRILSPTDRLSEVATIARTSFVFLFCTTAAGSDCWRFLILQGNFRIQPSSLMHPIQHHCWLCARNRNNRKSRNISKFDLPWFCWFHQIVQYLFSINCNLCCDFSTKLILFHPVHKFTHFVTSSLSKCRDEIAAYKRAGCQAVMEVDEDVQPLCEVLLLDMLWA